MRFFFREYSRLNSRGILTKNRGSPRPRYLDEDLGTIAVRIQIESIGQRRLKECQGS